MESNAIRLTNRTAIALRRQAKRTRNAYFVMGAVGTLLLLALAVYLGMMWLPAVPLLLALAVATDALLALSARTNSADALNFSMALHSRAILSSAAR